MSKAREIPQAIQQLFMADLPPIPGMSPDHKPEGYQDAEWWAACLYRRMGIGISEAVGQVIADKIAEAFNGVDAKLTRGAADEAVADFREEFRKLFEKGLTTSFSWKGTSFAPNTPNQRVAEKDIESVAFAKAPLIRWKIKVTAEASYP